MLVSNAVPIERILCRIFLGIVFIEENIMGFKIDAFWVRRDFVIDCIFARM